MCVRVNCDKCDKPTYAGCGRHVEQVLGGVPRDQRCTCREAARAAPPAGGPEAGATPPGFFERLFGGRQ
jgi:hypothetical protein